MHNEHEDVIWIKVMMELIGGARDVYMATTCISPTCNKDQEKVAYFQRKGKFIIQKDLNAHLSYKGDIIIPDRFGQDLRRSLCNVSHGNSEDTTETNIRSEGLLEICKSLNLITINGRKTGDKFGMNTSYQWNGKAVVDYTIASSRIFDDYSPFSLRSLPYILRNAIKTSP